MTAFPAREAVDPLDRIPSPHPGLTTTDGTDGTPEGAVKSELATDVPIGAVEGEERGVVGVMSLLLSNMMGIVWCGWSDHFLQFE